jgi:hypothetical protein
VPGGEAILVCGRVFRRSPSGGSIAKKSRLELVSLFFVLWGAPRVVAGNNDKQKIKPPQWTINDGARICYQHPLPAMRGNGKPSGLYNNPEVGLPGVLTTRDSALGEMILKLRNTINNERRLVFVDGRVCSIT